MPQTARMTSAERLIEKLRTQHAIEQATKGATVASFTNKTGDVRFILHESTRPSDAKWQLSRFDELGPSGHCNPPTFKDGLHRCQTASNTAYWNEHGLSLEWHNAQGTPPPF